MNFSKLFPECRDPAGWQACVLDGLDRVGIDGAVERAAFVAQVAVESGQFNRLIEQLDYRYDRLMEVWPKRFPTLLVAKQYAHQPERLANYVYASRLGNGPAESGDGWNYRGRGLLQLTGRANYTAVGARLGLPLVAHPELLEQKMPALRSAVDFWKQNKIGAVAHDVVATTRLVNGGTNGLDQRRAYFEALQR